MLDKDILIISKSGMFDKGFYQDKYREDMIEADPILDYVKHGWKKGRNPSLDFDTNFYLSTYLDIKKAKINPLVHYIETGRLEGRLPKDSNTPVDPIDIYQAYFRQLFDGTKKLVEKEEFVPYVKQKPLDTDIKVIAFYLPQFHPIPENDCNWELGFTEWTNVTKAVPQFLGHYQPRLPIDLGFYDLRNINVMRRQIELARNYGVHGFCFHHYWFNGKGIMRTPIDNFLGATDIDFKFCLSWANENWTKKWDGFDKDIILKQEYSAEDDLLFIQDTAKYFKDERYIRIDGKPLLILYRPMLLPNYFETVNRWRTWCKENGIGDIYVMLNSSFESLDGVTEDFGLIDWKPLGTISKSSECEKVSFINNSYEGEVYGYQDYLMNHSLLLSDEKQHKKYPSICPDWDNEARKPGSGTSYIGSSPQKYQKWFDYVVNYSIRNFVPNKRFIFVNAWNEWAEGAYLEPDRRYGYAYLQKTYETLSIYNRKKLDIIDKSHMKEPSSRVAVLLHLYNIDLWEEFSDYLSNFEEPFDLHISINSRADLELFNVIVEKFPNTYFYQFDNRGRDVMPFLNIFPHLVDLGYDYVCKVHSKKSEFREDGDLWRQDLVQTFLGSTNRIAQILKGFREDSELGLVVSEDWFLSYQDEIGSNHDLVTKMFGDLNIEMPFDFRFPGGTMFWFRLEALKKILELKFSNTDFLFEPLDADGAFGHAFERIIAEVVRASGYKTVKYRPV